MNHNGGIVEAFIELAKLSEKNGLIALHLELCALMQLIVRLNSPVSTPEAAARTASSSNITHLVNYRGA